MPSIADAQRVLGLIKTGMSYLPASLNTVNARTQLLAISGQEADWRHRAQILNGGGKGPARGLWQFERGGGVAGVMAHKASKAYAQQICALRRVPFTAIDIWRALETDDVLAVVFARLLLLTDPKPLVHATIANEQASWDIYQRNWRPGKPHRDSWGYYWKEAISVVAKD